MAARVNTRFVILLSTVLVVLVATVAGLLFVLERKDPTELMQRGDQFVQQGQYRRALENYAQALARRRNDIDLIQTYLQTLRMTPVKDRIEARNFLGQIQQWSHNAAQLRPDDAQLQTALYELQIELARKFNSVSLYDRLHELASDRLNHTSNDALARKYRGIAQVRRLTADMPRDKQMQALEDLTVALEQLPDDTQVLEHVARWNLFEANRLDHPGGDPQQARTLREEAAAIAQQILDAAPQSAQNQLRAAQLFVDRGINRPDLAKPIVDALEQQLQETPEPREDVLATASLLPIVDTEPLPSTSDHRRTAGIDRTRRLLARAMEVQPDDAFYQVAYARLLARTGQRDQAITALQQVHQQTNNLGPIEFLTIEELQHNAQFELADLLLDRVQTATDEQAKDEDLDAAKALLENLRQINAESPAVKLLSGKVALLQGRTSEAAMLLDQAIEQIGSVNRAALVLSATAHRRLGNWGTAAERLKTLLIIAPDLAPVQLELADIYLSGNQIDRARQHIEAAAATLGDDPRVQQRLARLFAAQGQRDQAIARYEQLYELGFAEVTRPLAQLYIAQQRQDDAEALLRDHLRQQPTDLEAIRLLAVLGVSEEETTAMIEAAREAGVSAEALSRLEQLLQGQGREAVQSLLQELVEKQDSPLKQALIQARIALQQGEDKAMREALSRAAAIDANHPQVLQMQFALAIQDEDWTAAETITQKAAASNADLANGAFFQARLAKARQQPDQATALYRRALSARPVTPDGWREFGDLLLEQGQLDDAASAYRTAIEQKPDEVGALRGLTAVADRQQRHTAALEHLKQAMRYAPRDGALLRYYLAYEQQHGNAQQARDLRQQLAERAPDDLDNRRALALLQAQLGEHEQAVATVEKLVEEHGLDFANAATLSTVHRTAGNPKRGDEALTRYIDHRGRDATMNDYLLLARYRVAINDGQGALQAYQHAMQLEDADQRSATRELADLLFNRGASEQALTLYQQLHESLPSDVGVALRLAEAYVRVGAFDEATALLESAPASAQRLALQAVLARKQGDLHQARSLIDQAMREPDGKSNAILYLERARLQVLDESQLLSAEADLNEALRLQPSLVEARGLLAEVLLRRGQTDRAASQLRTLLAQTPQLDNVRQQLVDLYVQTNDLSSAARLLDDSCQLFPEQATWFYRRGQVALLQDQPQVALTYWQQATAIEPSPMHLAPLASLLIEEGQPGEAVSLLRQHATVTNEIPTLQALRGKALAAQGQTDEALRVLTAAAGRCERFADLIVVGRELQQIVGVDDAIKRLRAAQTSMTPFVMELLAAQLQLEAEQVDAATHRMQALLPSRSQQPVELQAKLDQTLAIAAQQSQQHALARAAYEHLLQLQPQNPMALNNLAFLLANELNDPAAAMPLAEQAAQLLPDNPAVLDTLGWVQYKAGKLDDARRTLEKSLAIRPLAASYLHLAQVYQAQDRLEEAKQVLKQATVLAEKNNNSAILEEADRLLHALEQ